MSNVYINKALRRDIPTDAILLTRQQALQMHWNTVKDWKSTSDTWPFTYGMAFLTATNATTTLTIVQYYRRKLNLGNVGRVTMVLPTVFIPNIATTFAHHSIITSSIFLGSECPLCTQTRAAALQIGLGVIMPILISPLAGLSLAMSYNTFNVPPLKRESLPELFKIWVFLTKKLRLRLPIALGLNGFGASILTYFEAKSFYHIQSVIHENEETFRRHLYEEKDQ